MKVVAVTANGRPHVLTSGHLNIFIYIIVKIAGAAALASKEWQNLQSLVKHWECFSVTDDADTSVSQNIFLNTLYKYLFKSECGVITVK